MKALNLTMENTAEIFDVVEATISHKQEVDDLLKFDLMLDSDDVEHNVEKVAQIAGEYDTKSVIIQQTLHCQSALESALKRRGIKLFDSIAQWETDQLLKKIEAT